MAVWSCRRGGAFEPYEKEINEEIEFAFQEGYLAVPLGIGEGTCLNSVLGGRWGFAKRVFARDSLGFNGDSPPRRIHRRDRRRW